MREALCDGVQAFKEYYYEQRHLQLMSDLTPPSSMLESHRPYLSHVAGFFIVEEKVKQSTVNIIMPTELRSLWATAVSSIKNTMDAGFLETDSTAAMLVIKDYVYLTASCLGTQQFDVSAIMVRLSTAPNALPPGPQYKFPCGQHAQRTEPDVCLCCRTASNVVQQCSHLVLWVAGGAGAVPRPLPRPAQQGDGAVGAHCAAQRPQAAHDDVGRAGAGDDHGGGPPADHRSGRAAAGAALPRPVQQLAAERALHAGCKARASTRVCHHSVAVYMCAV